MTPHEDAASPPADHPPSLAPLPSLGPARLRAGLAALEATLSEPERELPPERRASLMTECGRLCETLGELPAARAHYERALAAHAPELAAASGLRRVLVALDEHTLAASLCATEAQLSGDLPRRAELLHERGRHLGRAGQPEAAREAYRAALALAPGQIRFLESLLAADPAATDPVTRDEVLVARLARLEADDGYRAALLAERGALLHRHLDRPTEALEVLREATAMDPSAPGALAALDALLTAAGRWEELATVLRQQLAQAPDAASQSAIMVRLARVLRDHLDRPDEALGLLHGAIDLHPGPLAPLDELHHLALAEKDPQRLLVALQGLAENAASAEDRAELWYRAGRLRERQLADEEGAIACYGQALVARADHRGARAALESLLVQQQDFARLVHTLEAAVANAAPEVRLSAELRAAEICERYLDDPEHALLLHQRVLATRPDHEPSLRAVTRLLQRLRRFEDLAEAYAVAAEQTTTTSDKTTYLLRRAEVQELLLDDPAAALATYRELLELDSRHQPAIHGLHRVASLCRRWEDLEFALRHELRGRQGSRAADILQQLGALLESELADRSAAVDHYRRALDAEPGHPLATASLEALLVHDDRVEELCALYRAELEQCPDEARRLELGWRVGHLQAERGDWTDASESLAPAARHGFAPARRDLDRLMTTERWWPELAALLTQQTTALEDDDARVRVHTRRAAILEHELGDAEAAAAAYAAALDRDPNAVEARQGLLRTQLLARDWRRAAEQLAGVGSVGTAAVPDSSYLEGCLRRDHLADPTGAIACFEAELNQRPGHLGALLALAPLYEAAERFEELASILAQLGRALEDGASRTAVLHRLTEIADRAGFGSPTQRAQAYRKLACEPEHRLAALLELERCALRDSPEIASEVAEQLAELAQDPALAARYLVRCGEQLEAEAPDAALERYRAALDLDPTCLGAIDGLAAVAAHEHRAADLERAAARHAELGSPRRAVTLWTAAGVEHARDDDPRAAAVALWRALGLDPKHPAARTQLVEVLRHTDLAPTLDALEALEVSATPAEQLALWIALAEALADDAERATALLERALSRAPDGPAVRLERAELALRQGNTPRAAELFAGVVQDGPPSRERGRAARRWAELCRGELADPARALELYEDVVAEAAADADDVEAALGGLVELRAAAGNIEDALAAAARLAESARSPSARLAALQTIVDLELGRDGHREAIEACARMVALEGPRSAAIATARDLADGDATLVKEGARALARALEDYATRQPPPTDATTAWLQAAELLENELEDAAAAIALLDRAAHAASEPLDLLVALGRRLERAARHEDALAHYRELLRERPRLGAAWRGLGRTFAHLTPPESATSALSCLVSLGLATPAEVDHCANRTPRALREPGPTTAEWSRMASTLGPEDRLASEPLDRLHEAVVSHLGRIFVPRLRELGLDTPARLTAKSSHPVRAQADRLAAWLGLADFHLYLAEDEEPLPRTAFTTPPSLILPRGFSDLAPGAQRFLLARTMAPLALGRHAAVQVDAAGLSELITAATRAADPDCELSFSAVDRIARLLRRFVPEAELPHLGTTASAAAALSPAVLAAWLADTHAVATRIALAVADDFAASLGVLARFPAEQRGGTDDELRGFQVTDAARELRRCCLAPGDPEPPPPEVLEDPAHDLEEATPPAGDDAQPTPPPLAIAAEPQGPDAPDRGSGRPTAAEPPPSDEPAANAAQRPSRPPSHSVPPPPPRSRSVPPPPPTAARSVPPPPPSGRLAPATPPTLASESRSRAELALAELEASDEETAERSPPR